MASRVPFGAASGLINRTKVEQLSINDAFSAANGRRGCIFVGITMSVWLFLGSLVVGVRSVVCWAYRVDDLGPVVVLVADGPGRGPPLAAVPGVRVVGGHALGGHWVTWAGT